jgi:hypothetical protein
MGHDAIVVFQIYDIKKSGYLAKQDMVTIFKEDILTNEGTVDELLQQCFDKVCARLCLTHHTILHQWGLAQCIDQTTTTTTTTTTTMPHLDTNMHLRCSSI